MNNSKNISIENFDYDLPDEKIALFPCENREESKLLIYKTPLNPLKGTFDIADNQHSPLGVGGDYQQYRDEISNQSPNIQEDTFKNITQYLPDYSFLVFNNTRVVQARLLFTKPTGSVVEIFCLEPLSPTSVHALAFEVKQECEWECFVGNNKRFHAPLDLHFDYQGKKTVLQAEKLGKYSENSFRIRFTWQPENMPFAEVLEHVGKIPLPPYIKRDTIQTDTERYQTVFAKEKGSVAAPTAGLHFTENVINQIKTKNIPIEYITLHVGAGTFKPVSSDKIGEHDMHCEQLFFSEKTIQHFLEEQNRKMIAVGTTTARSLESLYWIGVKLFHKIENPLHIPQWEIYENLSNKTLTIEQSLQTILDYMHVNQIEQLHASTALMITPYYHPKIVKGIITNFHQPKSTLLLLISAFVGKNWKNIYDYALSHDFRFLSYGDACLFL